MKKTILALVLILVIALSGFIGYNAGKYHVIYNQSIWVMEYYGPDDPFDVGFVVEIDNNAYNYDGFVGRGQNGGIEWLLSLL